jgi:hypothetical protein
MDIACFQGNNLRRLNLTLMLKTHRYSTGVIGGEALPHRCSLATLCTRGKVPIIVAILWGCCFLPRFLWVKWPCHMYHSMDTTIQKQIHLTNVVCNVEFSFCNAHGSVVLHCLVGSISFVMYCAERLCFSM